MPFRKNIFRIFVQTAIACACFAKGMALEVIHLDVPEGARESVWTDALADRWQGDTNVRVKYGRPDIVTEDRVIEVDRLKKYHEGLGQVFHYRTELPQKQGALAIIVEKASFDVEKLKYIESLCAQMGFEFFVLKRKQC